MRPLSRRRLLHGFVGGLAAGAALHARPQPAFAQVGDDGRAAIATAAGAVLAALPADLQRAATFALSDKERQNWHYVPRGREGVPLKQMPRAARTAAHELMKTSLSTVGYGKAVNVFRLEDVLRRIETFGLGRDPDNYAFTVFGTPGRDATWGWRLEGHHLSLNFTLVPGRPIAVTPAFFGANPAEVRSGPLQGLRTLAREEDLARTLAEGTDSRQRARMLIGGQSLGDIVSGPGRAERLTTFAGLPLAEMTGDQRTLALRLVEEYARNMRTELAEAELRRLREAGVEQLHFAWAGPLDRARPTTTAPRPHAAHRVRQHPERRQPHPLGLARPKNDFGLDLLRAHYERGHRHHHA
jgi:hypothetical protein